MPLHTDDALREYVSAPRVLERRFVFLPIVADNAMDGSEGTSRRREKSAILGTRVRPEVKERTEAKAEAEGVTVAEYLRRLVQENNRRDSAAAA